MTYSYVYKRNVGWVYLTLTISSGILPILCYPSSTEFSPLQPHIVMPQARKFAEKPNATKKVPPMENRNDLSDVQTNQIPQETGFSWSNMLGMVMQLLFNPASVTGPSKSDAIDSDPQAMAQSPWTNLLSVGLKILTAFLGGGPIAGSDGIDKVDNGAPLPMQFINIVMTLLDALKTSFSHRSMNARSLGRKDSTSDAAIAGLTMFKGYVKTLKTDDDDCAKKIVCEASRECADDLSQSGSVFCQLGTYATSLALQKSSSSPFDSFVEAGRRGRQMEDCGRAYASCNEA